MATTADFRNGFCMRFNYDIFQIVEFQHVKPGKGGAFVRTRLKSLTSGKVIDNTFLSGHEVEEVRVERRPYQYLYQDEAGYNFMNNETFDQVTINESLIDAPQFLIDGLEVQIVFDANTEAVLSCELPSVVVMEITYTEPGLRGDTATNASKPATVTSGATVKVPLFIEQGEKIQIDTKTSSYLSRAK